VFTCAHCEATLSRVEGPNGVSWACRRCGGRAAGIGLLAKTPVRDYVTRVWAVARLRTDAGGRLCPVCQGGMVEVPSLPDYASPTLDVCRRCHLLWFDPREFEQVPVVSRVAGLPAAKLSATASALTVSPQPEVSSSPAAAEIVAVERARAEAARLEAGHAGPDVWWQWIPGLLGLPVEVGSRVERTPWATWLLAAVIALVSIAAFTDLRRAVEMFGLIPTQADRYLGLTLLTSFFLHGGIMHLAGNLYYLLLFGDNVEDYLGRKRFLALVALAAVVGAIAHVAFDPRSNVPVIGASGGISGLVAFYGITFPRAKMIFLIWFRWMRVPAYAFLGFWLLLQILTAWQQISALTSVSALAHLGGVAVGVWFWLIWRDGPRARRPSQNV
jgi:membrane associated rhomboid family serine protease